MLNNKATVTIKRLGKMPMPVDVLVTFKDGSQEMHYMPLLDLKVRRKSGRIGCSQNSAYPMEMDTFLNTVLLPVNCCRYQP